MCCSQYSPIIKFNPSSHIQFLLKINNNLYIYNLSNSSSFFFFFFYFTPTDEFLTKLDFHVGLGDFERFVWLQYLAIS